MGVKFFHRKKTGGSEGGLAKDQTFSGFFLATFPSYQFLQNEFSSQNMFIYALSIVEFKIVPGYIHTEETEDENH